MKDYLKTLFVFVLFLSLSGCSPKAEKSSKNDNTEIHETAHSKQRGILNQRVLTESPQDAEHQPKSNEQIFDSRSSKQETSQKSSSRDREDVISEAIIRCGITLSENEKTTILKPVKAALDKVFRNKNFENLRSKVELRLDIREAQLRGDAVFDSLLNEHLGSTFSQAEWDNTLLSVPDLDVLIDTRRNLEEQFPKSEEEALLQAQDSIFRKALTKKLRDEITKHITTVSPSEVDEFLLNYRDDSPDHIFYMAKHENAETAALELKRDQYWNTWLASQEN